MSSYPESDKQFNRQLSARLARSFEVSSKILYVLSGWIALNETVAIAYKLSQDIPINSEFIHGTIAVGSICILGRISQVVGETFEDTARVNSEELSEIYDWEQDPDFTTSFVQTEYPQLLRAKLQGPNELK